MKRGFDFRIVISRYLKKTAAALLALLLMLNVLIVALPEDGVGWLKASAASSGTYGENLTWTLDDEGLLTISGSGNMNSGMNGG